MNPRELKLKFNITVWHNREINFWGIPKCANTSVKYALLGANTKRETSIGKAVHNFRYSKYISKTQAFQNRYTNITVTRHPFARVLSLYQDFVIRRPNSLTKKCKNFDDFIDNVILKTDDTMNTNIHFRSQCYFVALPNYNGLFPIDVFDITEVDQLFHKYKLNPVKINVTDRCGVELTQEQKDKIFERYKFDFQLLNYSNE